MTSEESDADDEMELTRQTDESGGENENEVEEPIPRTPRRDWEGREFRQAERLKKQIQTNDKLFRSKRDDPTRAELYDKLTKHYKTRPLEKAREYYNIEDVGIFEEVLIPEPLLAHDARMNKRKKIQDITQYIMSTSSESFQHSICALLDLSRMITTAEKRSWRAYSLSCESGKENTEFDSLTEKELFENVRKFVASSLTEYDKGFDTPTRCYDHCKRKNGFCFLLVRNQNLTNPKLFTNTVFAFAPGLRSLLIHFEKEAEEELFNIVAEGIGFGIVKRQRLRSLGLTAVYQSCTRTVLPLEEGIPNGRGLKALIDKFDQEEKEKNERGVYSLFPVAEKKLKIQCALLDDDQLDQPSGVNDCTIIYKVPAEPDDDDDGPSTSSAAKEPKMCEIKFKLKAKKGTLDQNIAELYRQGKISDITPFLRMKKSKSNTITVQCPNR